MADAPEDSQINALSDGLLIDGTDVRIGGIYQHYKGNQYRVHGIARHSETLGVFVYYECLYPNELGQFWVRPIEMFLSEITIGDQTLPRFKLI